MSAVMNTSQQCLVGGEGADTVISLLGESSSEGAVSQRMEEDTSQSLARPLTARVPLTQK